MMILNRGALNRAGGASSLASALAMAEMKGLVASLNKLELESPPQPSEAEKAQEKGAKESPPQQPEEGQPEERKIEEASPPQSSEDKKTEEKATEEPSPPRQPEKAKREEATYRVSEKKVDQSPQQGEPQSSSASSTLPPIAESETQKKRAEATFTSPDESKDDLLELTSATKGEGESSSAWELVPEKKIARKVGVESEKAVVEASGEEKGVEVVTPMPVDSAPNATEEVTPAEASPPADESRKDSTWQADFDFEDAPAQPKESQPSAGTKCKGLSVSQSGATKKRAIPLKSPRAASARPKLKAI